MPVQSNGANPNPVGNDDLFIMEIAARPVNPDLVHDDSRHDMRVGGNGGGVLLSNDNREYFIRFTLLTAPALAAQAAGRLMRACVLLLYSVLPSRAPAGWRLHAAVTK